MSPYLLALYLLLAGLLGGVLPLLIRKTPRSLHLLLSLAAGFFLGAVMLHLLPHVAETAAENGHGSAWTWVLVGLLAVLILDLGLFGSHNHANVGWAMLLGLTAHAFTAGLGLAFLLEEPAIAGIALAFSLHKLGECFSLVSALRFSIEGRRLTFVVLLLFSLVTPLGLVLGYLLHGQVLVGHGVEGAIAAISAGTFLYVAVGELLPEVFHETRDRLPKLAALLLGVLFAALSNPHAFHAHGDDCEFDHGRAGALQELPLGLREPKAGRMRLVRAC